MTCHRFERQVPDWLSRRLSPEHSEAMAAHEQECGPCRHAARTEADLRRCFREAASPPVLPDLWPCLALRLEAEEPKTRLFPQRWAAAAAIMLLALAACWSYLPGDTGAGRSRTTAPFTRPLPSSPVPAWSQLGSAAQDDPAVDDPIGPDMETLWTCLNTESK